MHENELPFINGGQHIEWAPDISTVASLMVIVASMAVATIASLIKAKVSPAIPAPAEDEFVSDASDTSTK
jgi:tellurite resistance protein TerC